MGNDTTHDDQLFAILKECKTLPVFLDHIFGFLCRRTDFYYVAKEPNPVIGLPGGYAEKIVKQTFYKWKSSGETPLLVIPQPPVSKKEEVSAIGEELLKPIEVPAAIEELEIEANCRKTAGNAAASSESFFTSAEHYNGSVYTNYSWSQSILEIDIYIKIPVNTTTKDLIIKISTDQILVKLKNNTTLLQGELCDKCKHTDVIWSLDKTKLNIHLDKCREFWWNCLVKSEEKLDVAKLDCSRLYEELPEEAHAKIEELQWNQERKRLGLPSSDQMAMHKVLKDAWNVEGSPFKGPFDPSSVQF